MVEALGLFDPEGRKLDCELVFSFKPLLLESVLRVEAHELSEVNKMRKLFSCDALLKPEYSQC
jgi:hypothetical protein